MTQTVKSQWVSSGWIVHLIDKPLVLNRIFFSVKVLTDLTADYRSYISLGDPRFYSYYTIGRSVPFFEAKGEGIFQGDIWVKNVSTSDLLFVMTEILV